jgi:hypothetical protein
MERKLTYNLPHLLAAAVAVAAGCCLPTTCLTCWLLAAAVAVAVAVAGCFCCLLLPDLPSSQPLSFL